MAISVRRVRRWHRLGGARQLALPCGRWRRGPVSASGTRVAAADDTAGADGAVARLFPALVLIVHAAALVVVVIVHAIAFVAIRVIHAAVPLALVLVP